MKFALSLVLLLISTPVFASEATDLVKLVISAYGGAETIEQIKSVEQSGSLESNRHGETGTITRSFSRPDKLRIDIQIPGAPPESRVLNGERGWRDGKEVPPMMAKAMMLQAARLDLPYLILRAGQDIKLAGPADRDNDRHPKGLEIPMAEGLRLIAIIDAKTGYIVSSHGLVSIAPNHEMEFTTIYSSHKEMNGMVVATEETHFVRGQATGKTVLDKSEVVQELSDAIFRLDRGSSI